MIFITLVGKQDTGKTTSIKMLANELLRLEKKTKNLHLKDNYFKQRQRSCIDQQKLLKYGMDLLNYTGDITIKFEWNSKSIGITSFGDDVHSIKTKYDIFKDCDIFVSAALPDDATINYIKAIVQNGTHIHIVINKSTVKAKNLLPNKDIKNIECHANTATAEELLKIVEYLL